MEERKLVNLAVVGATGMVGRTILEVLKDRDFPINNLYLFSSKKSAGQKVEFMGKEYVVEELNEESFDRDIDIALFSAGGTISEKFAPIASKKGVTVIDNSSFWRMNDDIPLIVPEVNGEDAFKNDGIIANPNCSTIQSVVPLRPLHDKYKIKRIIYNTYQAVSGSGVKGVADLENGTCENYPYSIAKNCLPHIDSFLDNGYTKEEMKMIEETQKILNDDSIKVTATTVRVPIKNSHAVSVNLEFEKPFEIEDIFELLKNADGVVVQDDIKNLIYPLEETANGKDEVFVGRIRRDFSVDNGINFWCVADNIRKGAATNTVQIAELIASRL
ncbi:aspartate-semialdehyde dehydrogenase [Miniphocaeibacter halophilus]|uniref:Aspartate-semialdehyde dehydrogenase n=1 Tax=Miniphocaeibacter halophilus TaxID=2931922 RepID=A0AC61MPT8_9FIRM|nr:aspartate-semialdehyde dehydrogenase [Miniphocaeibacter halophilus]QQK07572.1 aspartate-semialdehyde dehydrogenase [Miniphocaeibacter halophilus]